MNRRVLGGVIALVVVVVGVWFLWLRGDGDARSKADDDVRSGNIAKAPHRPPATPMRDGQIRWTLDADPEGPLRLEGQVLGPDGTGVGGATVWLGSVPPRSTKSDDDGSFHFEKLVSRTYSLSARSNAGGKNLISGTVPYKLTSSSDPAIVWLSEGASVTVTVVDESKAPIAGAEVRTADMGDAHATTDAGGLATLRPVEPGYVAVQATATGYAPNTGFATVGTAGITGTVTLTLHKGYALSGRVIDEDGKPIAKARVYASGGAWAGDRTPDDAGQEDARGRVEIVSDDKGQFAIPALSAGAHTLFAVDGEHAPGHTQVMLDDRPMSGVDIVMKLGGTIAGTVVDADRKPAPFVPVRISGTGTRMWSMGRRQAITDKAGKFELHGLVRAKLQARAESDRAASQLVPIDLTITPAKRDLQLVLDVTGTIAGTVVDDAGAPVPEVTVNAFPDIMGGASTEGLALSDMSSATTDGAGAFKITGLPAGAYKLWANRGGGGREWGQHGTAAKTGDSNVKLVLAAPGTLIGKVEIEGVGVPKIAFVQVGYKAAVPITGGAFTVKDLTPGKYQVTFRGPEFAQQAKSNVEIVPGKTTDLGTVKLFHGRRLTGKVVDSSGTPVASAKVKLAEILFTASTDEDQAESWEDIAGWRSTVTDQDGEFTLIGVPTKQTNAMADSPRGRSLAVVIPEGTEDPAPITLKLRGFGSISGRVVLKGEPQAGVTISESSKGGGAQAAFAQTDDAGNFRLPKVPEGTHVLQAMQAKMMAFKSTTVTVDVKEGRESKITIEIPVGQISLAVQIKPAAGAKVDAAQIFLFAGTVVAANAKQLTDSFFQGGVQGMKFWFGAAMPTPEFEELLPGNYSVCAVPITGNFSDPAFQQQIQANMQSLKVYCRQVQITPSPREQKVVHEVPGMDPLPQQPPS